MEKYRKLYRSNKWLSSSTKTFLGLINNVNKEILQYQFGKKKKKNPTSNARTRKKKIGNDSAVADDRSHSHGMMSLITQKIKWRNNEEMY